MNCKKCNAELHDGALFCPECMDRFAVNEQRKKVDDVSKSIKNVVVKQLHTPIFLVVACCFSAMFLSLVISMFSGGISSIFSNLLPFIFMLISVIGLWSGYLAKDTTDVNKVLRQASIYDAYNRVMYTISIVLTAIVGAIVAIMAFIGGGFLSGVFAGLSGGSEEDVANSAGTGGIIAFLVVVVIIAITITIISLIRSIYKNRRKYFIDLGNSVTTGHYNIEKAPVIGSYILGGYSIISVIPSLFFSAILELFSDVFADLGELGSMIEGMLRDMSGGIIISAIGTIILGAYYICSALWMNSAHKAQLAAAAEVTAEKALLKKIEDDTNEAIRNYELQQKKKHDNEKAAAELEAQQTQQALKEQQLMMQQMMMQMMMQQKQNNDSHEAAPEETPEE